MKGTSSQQENKFRKKRIIKKRWLEVVVVLSCIVVFITTYALILPAITLEQETYCNTEEHTHGAECYRDINICEYGESTDRIGDRVLVCEREETEGGEVIRELICGLSEDDGHVHDESCYLEKVEEPHMHSDECYHIHTEECFEKQLICEKTEHKHSLVCYSNPELTENQGIWEESVSQVSFTDNWNDNLSAVAMSQLGYKESTENYLSPDGETIKGYTRYGDWYADAYGLGDEVKYEDWAASFVSFCLNYARIGEEYVPRDNDVFNLLHKIRNNEPGRDVMTYISASEAVLTEESETGDSGEFDEKGARLLGELSATNKQRTCIQKGDLVFFDSDLSNTVDTVGIISDINADDSTITVIKGDDGDCVNCAVHKLSDETIIGFGILPTNPEIIKNAISPNGPVAKLVNDAEDTVDGADSADGSATILDWDDEYALPVLEELNTSTSVVLIKKAEGTEKEDTVTEYSGSSALASALRTVEKETIDNKTGTYAVVFVKSYALSSTDVEAFNSNGKYASKITFVGAYVNDKGNTVGIHDIKMGGYAFTLQTDTTFHHMAMITADSTVFYGAGHDFTIGESITMTNYVSLYGGMKGSCTPDYTNDEDGATTITILGGMYKLIVGGNEEANTFKGNINLYCDSVIIGKPNSDSAYIYAAQYYGAPAYFPKTNIVNATFKNVRAGTQYYNPSYTAYGEYYLYDCQPNKNNVVNTYEMGYLTDSEILEKLSRPESLSATVNLTIIDCDMPMQIDCRGTGTTLYAGGHIATTSANQMASAIIAVHRMEMLENSSFYQGVEYKGDAVFKNFVVHTDFVLHDNASFQINTGEAIRNWYIGNNLIMENDSSIRIGGGGSRGSLLVNGDVIVTGETYFTLYDGQEYVWEIVPLTVPNGTIRLNDNKDYGRFNLDVTYLGNHFAKGQVLVDLSSSDKLEASIVLSDGVRFTIEADEKNYDIIYGDYKDYVYDLTYKESVSISQMLEELNAFYPLTFFEGAYASGGNVTVNFANDSVTVNDVNKDFFIKDNYISLNKGSASLKIYLNHAHVIPAAEENIKLRLMNFNSGVTSQGTGAAEFYNIYDAVDGKRNATSYTHDLNLGKTLGTDGSPYSEYTGSLKNIFDPEESSEYISEDYTINGNTGLFVKDSSGYYHYDSGEYSAYYNKKTGDFDLFNYHTVRYNEDGSGSTTQASFYPFNLATSQTNTIQKNSAYWYNKSTNTLMLSRNKVDFWFGLNMEFDFQIKNNGTVKTAGVSAPLSDTNELTYEFRGSDDRLVYIDGVLVADITGRNAVSTVSINFATGVVTDTGATETTTLREIFRAAGMEGITGWNGDTFDNGSIHTLKMYATERDGDMNDLYMRFNIEPIRTKTIDVTKTVDYSDLTEEEKAKVDEKYEEYTFVMTDSDGNPVANQKYLRSSDPTNAYYTDSEGKFSIKNGETASFKVECDLVLESQKYTFTEQTKPSIMLSDKNLSMNTPTWFMEDMAFNEYAITVDIHPQDDAEDVIELECRNSFKVGVFIIKTLNITKAIEYTGMPDWVKGVYDKKEYTFIITDNNGDVLANTEYTNNGISFVTGSDGKFTLKNGETAVFTIPVNPEATGSLMYKITESSSVTSTTQGGYKVTAKVPAWKLGKILIANSWTYTDLDINSGKLFDVTCLNRFTLKEIPYKLTVSKEVLGIDTSGTFTFELTVKDSAGNSVDLSSQISALKALGATLKTDTDNVIQFSLSDGKSITFNSGDTWIIPKNAKLKLKETDHDGYLATMEIDGVGKYSVDTYDFDFTKDYSIEVINTQGTTLPRTGGRGTIMYIIGGALIIAGALIYGYLLRRRCRGGPSG